MRNIPFDKYTHVHGISPQLDIISNKHASVFFLAYKDCILVYKWFVSAFVPLLSLE